MHELGLAADLAGDLNWVAANADKFNLKSFVDVNKEPWHVQPPELPRSRRDYEAHGSPWATAAPVGQAPLVTPVSTAVPPVSAAGLSVTLTTEVVPGATGPDVLQVQAALVRLKLMADTPGNRDGRYGPATQGLVLQFQRTHGLKDDAKVGPKTWQAMFTAAAAV
jgi:Putative peptidoglycan binding domain